jgi:hypothetical protein
MIVMVVTQKNGVDRRQMLEVDARHAVAPRPGKRERATPIGPDRVGKNVGPALLEEHSCMIYQGDEERG